MGMFNFKRNHKKEKSKESTIIKGKSKGIFHFPFIFKNFNKKNTNIDSNTTENVDGKEQGYYFVSYSKSMEIRRASSTHINHINNQNNLVYNPYYNTKTIEFLKTSITSIPLEEQLNLRNRIVRKTSTRHQNLIEGQGIKKVPSENSLENLKNEMDTDAFLKVKNYNDISKTMKSVKEENIKPKLKSTMNQLNDFLNNERNNGLGDLSSYSDDIYDITSSFESYSKEKSTLLNIAEQKDIEVIKDDKFKLIEANNTPSSTQVTLGKDTSLINSLASESQEIKPPIIDELSSEIIPNDMEEEKVITSYMNQEASSHEKRKRGDSQSSISPFNRQSVVLIQKKKFKKDETKKSSEDPNFVKNYKKRMGMITGRRCSFVKNPSIVQGVKGPWKIVETTTMTAGIATSTDIIHHAITNNTLSNTQPKIFHSSSLPSLNTTLSNQKYLVTRHQIMSDSLLNEFNGVQEKSSQYSLEGHEILNDKDSDIISGINSEFTFNSNYSHDNEPNEQKSLQSSLQSIYKKTSPKLIIQNIRSKSLKAILNPDTKKLNINDEKRSPKKKIQDIVIASIYNQSSSQSLSTSTSINSINSHINIINTNINNNFNDNIHTNINTDTNIKTNIAPININTKTNINTNIDPININNEININTNITPINTDFNINKNNNISPIFTTTTTTNQNINNEVTKISNEENKNFNETSITTSSINLPSKKNSTTLFQDNTDAGSHSKYTSNSILSSLESVTTEKYTKDIYNEIHGKSSMKILKYHLSKPYGIENEDENIKEKDYENDNISINDSLELKSKKLLDTYWNNSMDNSVAMEARYFLISDDKKRNSHENNSYNNASNNKEEKNNHAYGRDTSFVHLQSDELSTSKISSVEDESFNQLQSYGEIVRRTYENKKNERGGYDNGNIRPILEKARKRKSSQRRKEWSKKKFKNNDNHVGTVQDSIRYIPYDSSMSYNSLTNMATITSLERTNKENQSQDLTNEEFLYNNYYNDFSTDKNKEHIYKRDLPSTSSPLKNDADINDTSEIIELRENYYGKYNKENINKNNQYGEKKNEANDLDTSFTSLEFKDTVISSVEKDISSPSHNNNSSFIHNSITSVPIEKSHGKIKVKRFKGKSPILPLPPQKQNFPRLIDVPGNSSMKKVYTMENIDKENYDDTFYSYAAATAADDTILSLPKNYSEFHKNISHNNIYNNNNNNKSNNNKNNSSNNNNNNNNNTSTNKDNINNNNKNNNIIIDNNNINNSNSHIYNINNINNIKNTYNNNYSNNYGKTINNSNYNINNNTVHILSSHCTQKTSTYNFLPKKLL